MRTSRQGRHQLHSLWFDLDLNLQLTSVPDIILILLKTLHVMNASITLYQSIACKACTLEMPIDIGSEHKTPLRQSLTEGL